MDRDQLIVDFWDVGQGNASVLQLCDDRLIIVDVGPRSSPLPDWLSARRSLDIAAIALTHNHEDHIGSLPSISAIPHAAIGCIYMLSDQDTDSDKFRRIMRPIREGVKAGRFRVLQLTAGQRIWEDHNLGLSLNVRFPDFISNLDAKSQNATSGIITLEMDNRIQIVWAGDAMLKDVLTVIDADQPFIVDGPHHGAPQDYRPNAAWDHCLSTFPAKRCHISVGTMNGHEHPRPKYLRHLAMTGRHVTCTQLTRQCDPTTGPRTRPIMQTHALLGLRPPPQGVACRGPTSPSFLVMSRRFCILLITSML